METLEIYHRKEQEVPDIICTECGNPNGTQAYSVILQRAHVTRKWFFCSLEHLRAWTSPIR